MKGLQHSLKQVQNRDSIKLQEIEKFGWNYFVFEDRYYTPKIAFQSIIKYSTFSGREWNRTTNEIYLSDYESGAGNQFLHLVH